MKIPTLHAIACGALALALIWTARRLLISQDSGKSDEDPRAFSIQASGTRDPSSRKLKRSEPAPRMAAARLSDMEPEEIEKLLSGRTTLSRNELRQFLINLVEEGFVAGNEKSLERLLTDNSLPDPMDALRLCDEMEEVSPFLSEGVFPFEMVLNAATVDPQAASAWVARHRGKFGSLSEDYLHAKIVKYAAEKDPDLAFRMLEDQPDAVVGIAAKDIAESAKPPEHRTAVLQAFRKNAGGMDEKTRISKGGILLEGFAKGFSQANSADVDKWLDVNRLDEEETTIFRLALTHEKPR